MDRDFASAVEILQKYIACVRQTDKAAEKLLENAITYAANPPPAAWSGASGEQVKH